MNTSKLKPGDQVEVNVRGLTFTALYNGPGPDCLGGHLISPRQPNISHRCVRSRQIVKKLGLR
jgi:hypothetical protein